MAKYNLLLLSIILLACSTIPARISGRRIDDAAMTTVSSDGGTAEKTAAAGVVLRSYNGCSYNPKAYDNSSIFCCDKDHQCWGSLQECMPNCPCSKANCGGKKGLIHRSSSDASDMTTSTTVQQQV